MNEDSNLKRILQPTYQPFKTSSQLQSYKKNSEKTKAFLSSIKSSNKLSEKEQKRQQAFDKFRGSLLSVIAQRSGKESSQSFIYFEVSDPNSSKNSIDGTQSTSRRRIIYKKMNKGRLVSSSKEKNELNQTYYNQNTITKFPLKDALKQQFAKTDSSSSSPKQRSFSKRYSLKKPEQNIPQRDPSIKNEDQSQLQSLPQSQQLQQQPLTPTYPTQQPQFKIQDYFPHECAKENDSLKDLESEDLQLKVQEFLSNQEDCIDHLAGRCICYQCPCGRCKCQYERAKQISAMFWTSNYQSDFQDQSQKTQISDELKVDRELYFSYKSEVPIEYTSTFKKDFKNHGHMEVTRYQQDIYQPKIGVIPRTSYKADYINFGGKLYFDLMKESTMKTILPELPFQSKTTYGESYQPITTPTDTPCFKQTFTRPYPTTNLFVGESSNHRDFDKKDKFAVKVKAAESAFFPVPSYIGQFNSQNSASYKQHEPVCIKQQQILLKHKN